LFRAHFPFSAQQLLSSQLLRNVIGPGRNLPVQRALRFDQASFLNMFALYYEQDDGRLTWIASCQDVRSARNIAQIYSTGNEWPVVCFYNGSQGTTSRCCHFKDGLETITGYPLAPAGAGHSRVRRPDRN